MIFSESRMKMGYTQQKVADLVHVSRQAISSYEKGRTSPDPDTLNEIMNVLNIPYHEVYGDEVSRKILAEFKGADPMLYEIMKVLKTKNHDQMTVVMEVLKRFS